MVIVLVALSLGGYLFRDQLNFFTKNTKEKTKPIKGIMVSHTKLNVFPDPRGTRRLLKSAKDLAATKNREDKTK